MNMSEIIIAVASLCAVSAIIGIALSIAEKAFYVEVNQVEIAVREALPGSNCGGCGYAGCDALAKAVAEGDAPVTACPVGGQPVAEAVAKLMGQEVGEMEKMVAYVRCSGTSDVKQKDYQYIGIESCAYAAKLPGSGPYACKYGCLGYGSCARACSERAIRIIDKKAVVEEALCVGCGRCIKACPHDLIQLVPAASAYRVQCRSFARGKEVMNACRAGCIGCGLCAKHCPAGAVVMENHIARIDYGSCTRCGICAEKCPRKIIRHVTDRG